MHIMCWDAEVSERLPIRTVSSNGRRPTDEWVYGVSFVGHVYQDKQERSVVGLPLPSLAGLYISKANNDSGGSSSWVTSRARGRTRGEPNSGFTILHVESFVF